MSVNITVNGKFERRPHPLLIDPHEARRTEEKERRKLRLLEVREESKKLAKKIRDEVNAEKKRELQKLQATKERELECWRQHALHRKGEEYRAAIFQIGTAHEAAKRENDKATKEKMQQSSYKNFKTQYTARKCQPTKFQFNCQPFCPCQKILEGGKKQFKCTCTQTEENNISNDRENAHKRKRDLSISSSESECEDEVCQKQNTLQESSLSLISTCDSTSSFSNTNHVDQPSTYLPAKNKCLIKTPAVCLDVEVGTDDSITINAPAEVKDKYVQYNRQFSSIATVSPRKFCQQKESMCENPSIQKSSTTTTLSSDMMAAKDQNVNMSCSEKSRNNTTNVVQKSKEKRFTIISDLVKKHQKNEARTTLTDRINTCPPNSQATSTTTLSPTKQSNEISVRPSVASPRKLSAISKSRTVTTQPLTSFATTSKSNTGTISYGSTSGRVQFYDYNSKLAKEQDKAVTTSTVQKQKDNSQPSAMEQAKLENQRERERQLEELKKYQLIEERGQKALEREQIRRDCHELTEKLEVLSREYANQLPTNENQFHIFADKQLRKEGKMNSAIEKLLQRPSIITCSEQNKSTKDEVKNKMTTKKVSLLNLLNVASLENKPAPVDDVSSDSCCSILLGYLDDQSRLVKQDLKNSDTLENQTKQKRLKNLLKRLDQLRNSLVDELKTESECKSIELEKEKSKISSKEQNIRRAIDSISELRKEHEQILINEKDKNSKPLGKREREMKAKEDLLERRVKEFFELKKEKVEKKSTDKDESSSYNEINKDLNLKEKMVCASNDNPIEIIITVKGDTKCVKVPQKSKRKFSVKKSPTKLSTLMRSPQPSLSKTKKHTPRKKFQPSNILGCQRILRRQNSYDSNSTSYMSLPPELPTKIDDLAQRITEELFRQPKKIKEVETSPNKDHQQEYEVSLESLNNIPKFNPPPRVNPLIVQYVHRLLGMSRNSVQKLGVSSSEIETPDSSIINISGNVANADNIISDERLITLRNFIEENKSFIKDVEESIRSQNNASLESSMRMLDDIWRKRLKEENKQTINSHTVQTRKKKGQSDNFVKDNKTDQETYISEKTYTRKKTDLQTPKSLPILSHNLLKDINKSLSSEHSASDRDLTKSLKTYKRPVECVDKAVNAKFCIDSSKTESDYQMARYAKLTENCTHRIAELSELINRVREEKQRLLEVTLSSVSDNCRHSTEYLELPDGKSNTRNEPDDITRISSSSEDTSQNKRSLSSNTLHEMHKLSSADKHKQIANSRDSGIAESRPITALENRIDQEPLSQTSSESTMPQAIRKMKPPPTLKRYSPQLPEDELAHELSTIFEVDTPATSRINTGVGQTADERENTCINRPHQPAKFPTFEQYIKELNLDITQLDPEQSVHLQQEFITILEYLQQNRSSTEYPKYLEFPSINAYVQEMAAIDLQLGETMEESLAKLCLSGIQPHNFPAVRDYIKNKSKSLPADEQQLLDTESLENITDAQTPHNTDNDTASLDIQAELKKRHIIKNPLRVAETKKRHVFSSTARKDKSFYREILAAESGLDKLSTSDNTSDLMDSDLKRSVDVARGDVKKKSKDIKILSTTATSTNVSTVVNSALRAASLDDNSKDSGRGFNLRDFLTRELEKLANNSGSTTNSSSDESLRNHFLHSLIGSLTPRTTGAASKSGGHTLDRQKTSTPVPVHSSRAHSTASNQSNSSNQLFSGESRISSVHYQDRSVRFFTSEDANADQSSK